MVLVSLAFLATNGCGRPGAEGYFFSADEEKKSPFLYCGSRKVEPTGDIEISLPCVSDERAEIVSEPSLFSARQLLQDDRCQLLIRIGEQVWDFQTEGEGRAAVREAHRGFLEKLEQAGTPPAGMRLIRDAVAAALPQTFDETLYYRFGFDPDKGYVDLEPGMRLRVDYQVFQAIFPPRSGEEQYLNGFVGSGTAYYDLGSGLPGAPPLLGGLVFNGFLSRLGPPELKQPAKGGAGGIIDLHKPGFGRPWYRLLYPAEFPGGDTPGWVGTSQNATLVGARTRADLERATEQYLARGTVGDLPVETLYFRGRAAVIPEIPVLVNDNPVYVPVGTTARQLLERYAPVPRLGPADGLQRLEYFRHQGRSVRMGARNHDFPARLKIFFFEVDPTRPRAPTRYWNGIDVFDLPVLLWDRLELR
jgi:hypothetical protein